MKNSGNLVCAKVGNINLNLPGKVANEIWFSFNLHLNVPNDNLNF